MNEQRFEQVTTFLKERQRAIFQRERGYKVPATDRLRAHLQQFVGGDLKGRLNVNQGNVLDILSWRNVDLLNRMAAAAPDTFRSALQELWSMPLDPLRADAFWATLDPALDSLPADRAKHVQGLGTRASIASYFLFIAEPPQVPFYRPRFGGDAIKHLYPHRPLAGESPGHRLKDYGERCAVLKERFNESGLPVADMLDVQSALYVLVQEHLKPSNT